MIKIVAIRKDNYAEIIMIIKSYLALDSDGHVGDLLAMTCYLGLDG